MSPRKPASTSMASSRQSRAVRACLATTACLIAVVLLGGARALNSAQESPRNVTPQATATVEGTDSATIQQAALLEVKRVCVATLSGDEKFAKQVQEMLISSLFAAKRLRVTENCERADGILKGTATENKEVVSRLEDEGIGFGKKVAGASGSWNQSGGSVSAAGAGASGIAGETLASSSVKNNTNLALRLVDKDGDVIWATTQESTGSKIRGPAADLADRAVKQLIRDLDKAEAPPTVKPK